jgi:hypothetical protein
MEAQKVVGITLDNLDEIAQPISEVIILLRSLLEEIEEKSQIYPVIKKLDAELDNILDILGCIYQLTWFNNEFMGLKQ